MPIAPSRCQLRRQLTCPISSALGHRRVAIAAAKRARFEQLAGGRSPLCPTKAAAGYNLVLGAARRAHSNEPTGRDNDRRHHLRLRRNAGRHDAGPLRGLARDDVRLRTVSCRKIAFTSWAAGRLLVLCEMLVREAGSPADPRQIAHEKEAAFQRRLQSVRPIEPVVRVVRQYRGQLPIAVATGAIRPVLDEILAAHRPGRRLRRRGDQRRSAASQAGPRHLSGSRAAAGGRSGRLPGLRRHRSGHRSRSPGRHGLCRRANAPYAPPRDRAGRSRRAEATEPLTASFGPTANLPGSCARPAVRAAGPNATATAPSARAA